MLSAQFLIMAEKHRDLLVGPVSLGRYRTHVVTSLILAGHHHGLIPHLEDAIHVIVAIPDLDRAEDVFRILGHLHQGHTTRADRAHAELDVLESTGVFLRIRDHIVTDDGPCHRKGPLRHVGVTGTCGQTAIVTAEKLSITRQSHTGATVRRIGCKYVKVLGAQTEPLCTPGLTEPL